MTSSTERILVERDRSRGVLLALMMLAVAAGLIGCEAEGPAQPNLVLITVDRLAADRLSCFGGASDAGASICALAEHGTLFAWTASAGRGEASGAATVLTGLPEAIHGVRSDGLSFLANAHPTIAADLSATGYATAAFVASPQVNHIRRLDQGFDLYDDRLASPSLLARSADSLTAASKNVTESVDLSSIVRAWIDTAPSPWFVWLHADHEAGLVELDRLLSRLSQTLDRANGGPGILFLALRGEREPASSGVRSTTDANRTIGWRSHRVPLIWRPPTPIDPTLRPAPVSRRLASLMDIRPTLRAAAQLPSPAGSTSEGERPASLSPPYEGGRDLSAIASRQRADTPSGERFVLLEVTPAGGDVGLASQNHLYTRNASPLDGTGRPVETSSLIPLSARFATLPKQDSQSDSSMNSARLDPGPWRSDVLDAESPVPRLEFHLARLLGAERDARKEPRRIPGHNPSQATPSRRDLE
jgi:hypothetical protein